METSATMSVTKVTIGLSGGFADVDEDVTRLIVQRLCASFFEACTLYEGKGLWQGIWEDCITVMIAGQHADTIDRFIREVVDRTGQDCVLLERDGDATLTRGGGDC